MEPIEEILKREFPELDVDIPTIPHTGDIKPDELNQALKYIRENKLVQDAISLLDGTKILRNSVNYPIIFPNQSRGLNFRVEWIPGVNVRVGEIQTSYNLETDIVQTRFYGMRIK